MVHFRRERGFTLIELMAVLAVLTIIAIIAVPAIGNILKNAESDSNHATVSMIEDAAEIAFTADNNSDIKRYTVKELVDKGYLDYDTEAEGAETGAVVHQGDGIFEYARPNLMVNTDRNGATFTKNLGDTQAEFIRLPYNLNSIFDEDPDATYTLSFDVRSKDSSKHKYMSIYPQPSKAGTVNKYHFPYTTFEVSDEWSRFEMTFKPNLANPHIDETMMTVYGTYNTGNIPELRHFKLEKGASATPWIPHENGS